jgi:hypothetical protein
LQQQQASQLNIIIQYVHKKQLAQALAKGHHWDPWPRATMAAGGGGGAGSQQLLLLLLQLHLEYHHLLLPLLH